MGKQRVKMADDRNNLQSCLLLFSKNHHSRALVLRLLMGASYLHCASEKAETVRFQIVISNLELRLQIYSSRAGLPRYSSNRGDRSLALETLSPIPTRNDNREEVMPSQELNFKIKI